MGVCVSVYRDSAFGSKQDGNNNDNNKKQQQQVLMTTSPTKVINNNKPNGIAQWPPITQSAASFPDLGSKDESFFDSQAWLDSDCEDDFMSVKGDFTPSRGNTPVHHNFSAGTPKVNGALLLDQTTPVELSEPSPNTRNKRLSDLFNDSLRANNHDEGDNEQEVKMSEKLGTPEAKSVSSDGKQTPNGDFKPAREKSMKSTMQGCLPSMLSSCSYTERKKKMSQPAPVPSM